MTYRFHKGGKTVARAITILGALLIVVSQAIGAAHFHASEVSRGGVIITQLDVGEGLCPICQVALHAPGSIAAAPTVVRGPAIAGTIFLAAPIRPKSPVFLAARVRAPPVSL